jgi:hypothetical protein
MHQEYAYEKGLSDHSNSVVVFDVGGCAKQWFVAAHNTGYQQLAIAKLAVGYKPQQLNPEHFAVELFTFELITVEFLPIQRFAVG